MNELRIGRLFADSAVKDLEPPIDFSYFVENLLTLQARARPHKQDVTPLLQTRDLLLGDDEVFHTLELISNNSSSDRLFEHDEMVLRQDVAGFAPTQSGCSHFFTRL